MLLLIYSETSFPVCKGNDEMNLWRHTSWRHTSWSGAWAGSSSRNHPFYRNQLISRAKSCSQAARCLLALVCICQCPGREYSDIIILRYLTTEANGGWSSFIVCLQWPYRLGKIMRLFPKSLFLRNIITFVFSVYYANSWSPEKGS